MSSSKSGHRDKGKGRRSTESTSPVQLTGRQRIHSIMFADYYEDFDYNNDVNDLLRDLGVSESEWN